MLLSELLRLIGQPIRTGANLEISGVEEDSRRVSTGTLFIARPGTKTDGSQFVPDAQARGAVAAIVRARNPAAIIPQIVVDNVARTGALAAHAFYGNPGRALKILSVTGTNGKTTTVYLIRHLLAKAAIKCGMIGTVEIDDGKSQRESDMTTPGACDVARLLAAMRDHGCSACAMEVSSHALHQERVAGIPFAGAAFTNLTGDHLDYHGPMENYAAAKALMFESLEPGTVAAVNGDHPWTTRMIRNCSGRVVRFGFGESCDYRASNPVITAEETSFNLTSPRGILEIRMPMVGKHNIENALAAIVLCAEVMQLPLAQIAAGLLDAHGAPGRLEPVRAGQPFAVLVDYAHTDDALENVLSALRPLTKGRLHVVFGCGGDRDRTKRPRMGEVAARLADCLYVTSDNPRSEEPAAIIAEILKGIGSASAKPVIVEADRRTAIGSALSDAKPGDVVLIAGKGHENYQIIGSTRHHFDDREEAQDCLKRIY